MKIAFIVQRCGKEVFGGAEALTLQSAQALSENNTVEILTTRAIDAGTWKNHYSKGTEKIGKLLIRRFSVDRERDPNFVPLSQYLEKNNNDMKKGTDFVNANGPVCNDLIEFIKNNKNNYDILIFVGYLYWLTFYGLNIAPQKSVLLSTVHYEPWAFFKIYEKVFQSAAGYIFLTNAEKEFVHKKFGHIDKPYQIVGHGIDDKLISHSRKPPREKLPTNYLLYVGRISAGKGCQLLSNFFNKYKETHETDLQLVMLGDLEHEISNCNALILNNLSDEEKFYVLQKCKIFIMPSQFESLNIACLEAWLFRKPILVNAKSAVLKEHSLNSNGALYFENYEEFAESLNLILNDLKLANSLAINGKKYVQENYNWQVTIKKYNDFFRKILHKNN